jgi:hypothetical protein
MESATEKRDKNMRVSKLISLKDQEPEEKAEPVTVRIPVSYVAHLDELSSSLDVTRHLLLTEMIKDGVDAALLEFDKSRNKPEATANDEDPTSGTRFFILNTNKGNDVESHLDMVTNGVAAAFCDPWKYQIERLKEGSVVFLYENGTGIVGTGIAPGEVEKVEYHGVSEDAYRKKLVGYRRVKPLDAREIKKVVGGNLIFLRTLFKVPTEYGQRIQENLQDV